VIPMRVADQNVTAHAFGACRHQLLAERVPSGSASR